MTDDDRRLLIALVAALEALHAPFRARDAINGNGALACVLERRAAYRSGAGLAWKIGGNMQNRQAGLRSLKRLQSSGLIRLIRGASDIRAGVALRRVDAALSLTPTRLTCEVWHLLERVGDLMRDPTSLTNCGFVSEHDVVGVDRHPTDGKPFSKFENDATALLIAGYLDTATDTRGAIGWKVTPEGRKALAIGKPEADDMGEYDRHLADEYLDLVRVALEERATWLPDSPHVAIPMSAGLWEATDGN